MLKKNYFAVFFCLVFLIGIVSAVKPLTSINSDVGFFVRPVQKSAIEVNMPHQFDIHVFNISNGVTIVSGISCYMHLYHETGEHIYRGFTSTSSNNLDYEFNVSAGNFTSRGEYQALFQCNDTKLGGESQLYFMVNGIGEELTTAHSIKFNSAMFLMMILFLCSLIGIFKIENYIGKFACYWICHVFFIVGTFNMWQFNMGYTTAFTGLAGVWKVLFYVSIYSMLPMIIVSIAWIVYIHTYTKEMRNMAEKGMSPEEAFRRVNNRRKYE